MKAITRKLLRDYFGMLPQVVTIGFLIMGGVAVLVSSWSSYQSLQVAKSEYFEKYRFADLFVDLTAAPETLITKISSLEGIEFAESRIVKDGLVEVEGQPEPALGRFISWADHQKINLLHLRHGRLPGPSSQTEVVVHEAFAQAHKLKVGDSFRANLAGRKVTLVISGIGLSPEYVYALSPIAFLPDDLHFGIFWMRRGDLENYFGLEGSLNGFQATTARGASIPQLRQDIERIIKPYGGIQVVDRSRQISAMFVEDEIRQQRIMAIVMPAIFLGVAIFILNVIVTRLIWLHRAKIATLKSLGYSAWTLTMHYFSLVTLVLLSGTIPSLFIGAWIGRWYADLYRDFFRFPSIDFSLSPSAVVLGLAAGLVPGWLVAARALAKVFSLNPAEALRPPSPPLFSHGLLEKLGLSSRLGVHSKMVLRSLLKHPGRLSMNILGMSLALAIIINGSFWTDVIDFMIDRQFRDMRREDLTVRLVSPKGVDALTEISRLPGVMWAEGERSAGVRLEYRNIRKELSLQGFSEGNQLTRVLDQSGNVVNPKQGGVVLSRYFEKEFGLKLGTEVILVPLIGSSGPFPVTVLGFVDDLIGQQAYAIKSDVHRWLKENAVMDTIQLKIDPAFAEQIYVSLKQRPDVAGVSIRKLVLKSFTETMGGMITVFSTILFLFAVGIAAAVLYNSARIAFSERGWELASLRILGLDLRAAFEILFLELGIQVLVALIPGLFIGYFLSFLSTRLIHNDTFTFPLVIDITTYAVAVLVIMGTFAASGALLFRKVRGLDFAEALKARE